jgi:hypothetical protein
MPSPDTYDYQIGVTSGSMVKLESLTTPVSYPKSTFTPYVDKVKLVSGMVRGLGYPKCTWFWGVITREERDQLRSFCVGQSARVFIRTKTMDTADSYANYSAVMVWDTLEEERDTQRRVNLKIDFENLVPA